MSHPCDIFNDPNDPKKREMKIKPCSRGRCCVCRQGFGNWSAVLLGDGRKAHSWDYRLAPEVRKNGSRRRHE